MSNEGTESACKPSLHRYYHLFLSRPRLSSLADSIGAPGAACRQCNSALKSVQPCSANQTCSWQEEAILVHDAVSPAGPPNESGGCPEEAWFVHDAVSPFRYPQRDWKPGLGKQH